MLKASSSSAPEAMPDGRIDMIHALDLSILPFQTARLKRARLFKNPKLDSVVEMFATEGGGSAQVDCNKVFKLFTWPEGFKHPDQQLLVKLGALPSYDVLSLRVALRRLGIKLDNPEALKFPDAKIAGLKPYRNRTIAPMMQFINSDKKSDVDDYDKLLPTLKKPSPQDQARLQQMAVTLGIEVTAVPLFVRDYGEIALSLAYYQEQFDDLLFPLMGLLDQLKILRRNPEYNKDAVFMRDAELIDTVLGNLIALLAARFENFYMLSKNMWLDIKSGKIMTIRNSIVAHHATISGMLCGLSVKMRCWEEAFAGEDPSQQPKSKWTTFIQSAMVPGLLELATLNASN